MEQLAYRVQVRAIGKYHNLNALTAPNTPLLILRLDNAKQILLFMLMEVGIDS